MQTNQQNTKLPHNYKNIVLPVELIQPIQLTSSQIIYVKCVSILFTAWTSNILLGNFRFHMRQGIF